MSASSISRLRPTLRATGTAGVWQNQPPWPPGSAKLADSAATARSQLATSWQPAAVAMAWTRAITTCGTSWIVRITDVQSRSRSRTPARSRAATSAKSWPAENALPSAPSTMPVRLRATRCLERVEQLAQVRLGERVATFRPVHRDPDGVAVVLDQQVLVIGHVEHGTSDGTDGDSYHVGAPT